MIEETQENWQKSTFFVLLHIRGFIWNRGQTILLYAIECDTLSFSLAVKIPDFGHWMRRAAAKPSTQLVEIISELVFLFCTYSAFSLDFFTQYCFTRNAFIRSRMYSNFEQFYGKREENVIIFRNGKTIPNSEKITSCLIKPYWVYKKYFATLTKYLDQK